MSTTIEPVLGSNEVLGCRLVGGFSIFVQVLVGTLGFSTLIIKRYFERPRRSWLVWGFDVSKQMISGSIMHMCNLLVSALSGTSTADATNPCAWYVLNLTLDCTIGVAFIAGYLKLFEALAAKYKVTGLESGHYGDPPSWRLWLRQASMFCLSMLCMKLTVIVAVALFPFLVAIGNAILVPVQMTHSPRFEIVFVMAIWPLVLNIFESWVIDQFIKKKHAGHVPLNTDEHTFEMQNASVSSGSRTLQDARVSDEFGLDELGLAELGLDELGLDEYESDDGKHRARAYHDRPFEMPSPVFTPTESRANEQ
ncbi:hypothetical protein IW148_003299 [Coemansia sp. RSA 1199]|nr:hypothetical protein IW148_003299 [Coemansia sp. RSA 1199]